MKKGSSRTSLFLRVLPRSCGARLGSAMGEIGTRSVPRRCEKCDQKHSPSTTSTCRQTSTCWRRTSTCSFFAKRKEYVALGYLTVKLFVPKEVLVHATLLRRCATPAAVNLGAPLSERRTRAVRALCPKRRRPTSTCLDTHSPPDPLRCGV